MHSLRKMRNIASRVKRFMGADWAVVSLVSVSKVKSIGITFERSTGKSTSEDVSGDEPAEDFGSLGGLFGRQDITR